MIIYGNFMQILSFEYFTVDITVKDMTSVLDNLSNIRHAGPSIDRKDLLNSGIYTAYLVTCL